ncbi:MAG: hypothetical protein JNJ99_15175 [Crocinitomicaceae bacterium]|nr:hypothetical protein [Crocinitomicaceae bacterium]
MKQIYYGLLAFFFLVLNSHKLTAAEILPLEALVNSGKISVSFISKGGYQGNCMQMIVHNHSADSVYGFVEPGRKLNSVNDGEQDILVVKAAQIKLKRFEKDTLDVFGFCCQSGKSGPSKNALYTIGSLAPAAWIFIANLINLNQFPNDAIQHAVWVLSDNHDIRSIPAYSNPAMDQLRYAVADILDIEIPWYSFRYKSDENDLFTGIKTHFFAEVAFNIPQRALITPQITRPNGEIIYTGEHQYFSAGDQKISVSFPISGWEDGEYDFYLLEDFHTTNKKLRFNTTE